MIRRKRAEETATTNETTTEDDVEAILSEEIYEEQLDRLKMFIGTSLADSQSRLAHLTDQIHQMTGYLEELQMRPEWGRLNFIYSAWNTMVDTSE